MRRVAAALLLAGPAAALHADPLPSLIGNRVAGTPVDCIERAEIDKVRLVANVGFVFEMKTRGVLYLNRVTSGRTFVHDGVTPMIEPASSRLCSVEPVQLLNENSRAPVASVTLGAFTPFQRP